MILTCETLDAEQALQFGIINKICDNDVLIYLSRNWNKPLKS